MLQIAFKEWAVIEAALAKGRQSLLIRKGGIAETGGVFTPEHERFWIYPTTMHQHQQGGIIPGTDSLLSAAHANTPPAGRVVLSHFVDVKQIWYLTNPAKLASLDGLHIWDAKTLEQRFHYRSAGLYVLLVRTFTTPPKNETVHPDYEGCKTWVELKTPCPTTGAVPVLDDVAFANYAEAVRAVLAD